MAKFPPLPEPDTHCWDDDTQKDCWSHSPNQLRARDLEIWRMVLEAAADVCEQLAWPGRNHSDYIQGQNDLSDKAATAIRALPEPVHE